MSSARFLPVFAVAMLALAVAGCQDRHEWNQKLTVVVETPRGEVSGSSVVGVVAWFGQVPASASEVDYEITGEATVVEVSPGRYLFALLGGSEERFYHAALNRFEGMRRGTWLAQIPNQTEPVTLTGTSVPMLVTFTNLSDPATVRRVDPADLTAAFGPGHALKAITLEISKEPVTAGRVDSVLAWFHDTPYRTLPLWPTLTPLQHETLSNLVIPSGALK